MRTLAITLLLLLTGMTLDAYAACTYKGRTYPTGSRVGPYVCQPDGTWK